MCGIVAVLGAKDARQCASRAIARIRHRGPDALGEWHDDASSLALAHARLSIIDLSDAGRQPMASHDARFVIVFNGELYNYLELKSQLPDYPYRSHSDTEVVLAAWERWGEACLDRFVGMFAFVLWDARERRAFAVRDRFGVKPLYLSSLPGGGVALASEIKALHAAGVPAAADPIAWATYLATGLHEHSARTFWQGVESVPAGSLVTWTPDGARATRRWYDLAARVGDGFDERPIETVRDEYLALLEHTVRLRFRSDVPVGINLSGGLDSSILLGLVHAVRGKDSDVTVFTFATGDANYDELPWVEAMLAHTRHLLEVCSLTAAEVPALAARIADAEDEPFGGVPTLAYSKIFARARERGIIVLLDGQGLDEQWAGYDYYRDAVSERPAPIVQGSKDPAVRVDCLAPELAALVEATPTRSPFPDRLRNLQLRDTTATKIPRALRYNDRISMASSTELREPFLDHRLFELALRQPADRKIREHTGKWLLRQIAATLVPESNRLVPKRPVQTPQREWLRGPLRAWASERLDCAFRARPDWFDTVRCRTAWADYQSGRGDNSFWVWQWLSAALSQN